jgi:beta-lactamase superfamily II metal-dependent hydrolase
MRIYVFDMGTTKYGDSLLVTHNGRRILIDGGHPGDFDRIRGQLKKALGHSAPFDIDLLVVTHCHNDHIGCLPALVGQGVIRVKKALVADELLGWGRNMGGDSAMDARGLTEPQKKLVAALHEEDMSRMTDDELEGFFEDITLEEKYKNMLGDIADGGATVVRFGVDSAAAVAAIENDFADFGFKVLGPTEEHLLKCWEFIADASDTIAAAVQAEAPAGMDSSDLVGAYRRMVQSGADDPAFAADQPGIGAAKNDQSIVIKLQADGWKAMLGGDMQFAVAEVPGLDDDMEALRQTVVNAGPYHFIKLTHHTSYNALDTEILAEWLANAPGKLLLAHTGGSNDAHHPEESALDALEAEKTRLVFARTDRNRMITVRKHNGQLKMFVAAGQLNDFSSNSESDVPTPIESELEPTSATTASTITASASDGVVEVTARIPHVTTKVTISINVEPASAPTKKKTMK